MHITLSSNKTERVAKEKMCYNVHGQIQCHSRYIEPLCIIRRRGPIFVYFLHPFKDTAVDVSFNGFNIFAAILDQASARVLLRQ